MTTSATTTNTENKKRARATKPSKLTIELANKCLAKLGKYWTMTSSSSLMSDGSTQHYFSFVLDSEKAHIITKSEINHIVAFATMVDAFSWYIHKDFDTDNLAIEVSLSTNFGK